MTIEKIKENYTELHNKLHDDYKNGLISESDFICDHDAISVALDLWYLENGHGQDRVNYIKDENGEIIKEEVIQSIQDQINDIKGIQSVVGVVDLENGKWLA
jgi:hypothetical protein